VSTPPTSTTGAPVVLYDTTLRDGTQGENITLSLADKIRIARMLDEYGMPYIEGGWPGSNPKDIEFFAAARTMTWQHARLAAFGSTRHKAKSAAQDPNLYELVAAETPVVTIFGKSWDLHVLDVLGASLEQNLDMIGESVAFVGERGREVIYDAEHYFDGYKADRDYALRTLRAARDAGARDVVLCDTNGGTLTDELLRIFEDTRDTLAADREAAPVTWGIHTHNDAELAVANALAAVSAGARHVQATINGYGERCGNANMVSLMANLALKTDLSLLPAGGGDLSHLTTLSRTVAEIANVTPLDYQPFVGRSAFAHKGGVHGAAVAKVERSYQHVDPGLVGNRSRLVVSELGGRANTRIRAEQLGHDLEGVVDARALSQTIKELENQGLAFEGAEASFELLIRRQGADYRPPFRIVDYTVLIEQREGQEFLAEATVKVRVDGQVVHTAADGNGPVNALDAAMRKALGAFFPRLETMRLVDYKVRIIDGTAATAARTRVIIDSLDEGLEWSTMGSDTNIISASAAALADSFEYAIWKRQASAAGEAEGGSTAAATATPASSSGLPASAT
jgi:2-isopropylmalate synthase